MSSSYTLDKAELLGGLGETTLYGLYVLCMFPATVFVLRKSRRSAGKRLRSSVLFIGSVLLFLMVTAHWIIDLSRLYDAFITTQPRSPVLFYAQFSEWRGVTRIALFVTEVVTLDLLLLYRLFVIWSRNYWVLILPALTLLATTASVIVVCIGFADASFGENLFASTTGKWIITAFTCTLATNVLAVGLMAFKILRRDRALKDHGVRGLTPLLVVIIEGAGIYCVLNFISMVGVLVRSNVNFTTLALGSPITGISFCLITLRVGLGHAVSDFVSTQATDASRPRAGGRAPQFPMRVCVTRDEMISVGVPDLQLGGRRSDIELNDVESSLKTPGGPTTTWV